MKYHKIFKIIFTGFFAFLLLNNVQAQDEKYVNIFIFDVTGSMEGRGDGAGLNIFDDVKDIASRIVRGYSNDTYLVIMPFGRGVQENNLFEKHIRSESDKEDAVQFINSLAANEPETWLSYSLRYGIDKLHLLEEELSDFNSRTQQLLLLTDGRGNGPGDLNENGDFDTDGIIEQYRIAKTDFPALYSRFFTVGDILTPDEREQFIDERISVTEIGREEIVETNIYTVQVRPNHITVYNTSPSFSLDFQSDENIDNLPVEITITSPEIEDFGSTFEITPETFQISNEQSFEVSILNENIFNRWMQENEIDRIEGFINLEADRIYFQPESQIPFTYQIEPVNVTIEYEEQLINNTGHFSMRVNNPSDTPFEANLEISSITGQIDNLDYNLDPDRIRVEGNENVSVNVNVENTDVLDSIRNEIEAESSSEMLISIKPITPNTTLNQSDFLVGLNVTPDRSGLYIMIALIVFLIILISALVAWYLYKTDQAFGEYEIVLGSGVPQRLNQSRNYFKTKLTVGKDIFGDVFNEEIVTITAGLSVMTDGRLKVKWSNQNRIEPNEVTDNNHLRELDFTFDKKSIRISKI